MKKNTLLLLSVLSLLSCRNSKESSKEIENALIRITNLEEQNRKLTDSLNKYREIDLNSQSILGFPQECILKVGKKNKIKFVIFKNEFEFPKYDIYKIENDNEIKIGENNNFNFDYEFTPKSIKDNRLNLKIKMPYKGEIIELPILMNFKVE